MLMLTVTILFFVFLFLNMPLAFAIGASSLFYYVMTPDLNLGIAVQRMVSTTQSFPLLAIPFFIMAGNLMNSSGITKRLITLSNVLTGHFVGGLAHVSIMLSALMGGISGSAIADAAMEARILGPDMLKKGYSKGYSSAVISLSSLITATIPPSVGLIVYGFIGEVSIGRLFAAGIVPGLLMTVFLMVTATVIGKKRGYTADREKPPTLKEVFICIKESIWAVIFPIFLIVGIRFGLFTPTEAGAFAIVYALLVGIFAYKELNFKSAMEVIKNSMLDNGTVMLIITAAAIFGYASVYDGLPHTLATLITGITTNKYALLFIIIIFLFIAGMFMESTVNCLLFTPIFLPIMTSVGVDPVHFGIIMMTIVTLGCMTPPVGVAMFAVCQILDCPVEKYTKESIPFMGAVLLLVAMLVCLPDVVLFLPNMIFGK